MKIICRHEHCASHYIYAGLGRALQKAGHEFYFWKPDSESAFDMFNTHKPDVFIGQGYELDRATIKCINARPEMKVFLKVGAYSKPLLSEPDLKDYQILVTNDNEITLVTAINNRERVVVFNYCHPKRAEYVIGDWNNIHGLRTWGLLPAADTDMFYPVPYEAALDSDMIFAGGYWEYKARNLDRFIVPLCNPIGKYRIKIFGNQHWPVPQFVGFISDETLRKAICSAKICPNIHEPHSNRFGFDVVPRIFNILACDSLCISDYVESLAEDIFTGGELPMAKTPEEFFSLIDTYLYNEELRRKTIEAGRKIVMENHTYQNRVKEMMELL